MAKKNAPKVDVKPAADVKPAVVPVVAVAPVTNDVVDVVDVMPVSFDVILKQLTTLTGIISSLKNDAKTLQKQHAKDLKLAQKSSGKRKPRDPSKGAKAPSGFVKPTLITDELAQFLGKPSGSQMARTEVTREINLYIRANKLQDATNGRKIIADAKLTTLLKLTKEDELTYFNLQRYMSPHFAKGGVLPGTTPVATK